MSLEEWDLKIQSENPVDFISLAAHNCDIGSFYEAQGLGSYFNFLNGPTYQTLVRHFWVIASIFDRDAAKMEEDEKVLLYPELKGKSRQEMGLEPFTKTQIRSSIMGIPVWINEDVIAFVLRRPAEGDYKAGITKPKDSPWNDIVNKTLFNKVKDFAYADMNAKTKVMLKIQNDNLLPKGGGSDQPSLEHKILLHFFITGVKANVPRYIFRHMVQQLRESQLKNRCWVPYGRLLSEIFHQGGIIKMLKEAEFFTDEQLGTVIGKIINGETLRSMHLIDVKDLKKLPTDMKASDAKSALIPNFPPICKQDPLDVQMNYIRDHFERTREKISLKDVPEQMFGGVLPVAKSRKSKNRPLSKEEYLEEEEAKRKPSKRTRKETKVEVAAPKPKKSKANVSASEQAAASEEVPASEEDVQKQKIKKSRVLEEEPSAKKAKSNKPSVMPMFVPTEEQWQYARNYTATEMARRKQLRQQKKREEQLKAAGNCPGGSKTAISSFERQAGLGATSSEPASKALEAAHPEAHSSGTSLQANINTQILDLPSSPSSSSTESDDQPLSQHIEKLLNRKPTKLTNYGTIDYEQTQIEFTKQRIKICEKINFPPDHFFQPQIPEAVSIQFPETNPQNNQSPQKASEVVSEATTSETPQQQGSSTLYNLEKHLGGEMQPTPTKASKTVPEKTILNNQQTITQTETVIPEPTVPEPTVPEQTVSDLDQTTIEQPQTNTEQQQQPEPPIIDLTSSDHQTASNQPSTSQTPIPDTILESEYIDEQLIRLSDEIQSLILLRTVPVPPIHYLDQWMDLKKGFNKLLDQLSTKCVSSHSAMLKKLLDDMHEAARVKELDYVPLLANSPFYPEAVYISRADRIQEGLRRRLRAKDEELQKQSEQIKFLLEQVSKLSKP
ncbi:hypothetical protein MTR_3g048350 [Medicago truncatula]|uniref:Uncharacterized protein n=1 Tax=Medicago truncatula TaxID=3880 RepID=G7IZU7_MEDTR|nr:hypothetical protein MTR_3g048350 [Medicago truncatula]